jgi:hypothetical protein
VAKELSLDEISDKEVREVARWARDRHGCSFTKQGKYVQVLDPAGRRVTRLPTSPSKSWRESKAAEFRAAGFDDVGFPGLKREPVKPVATATALTPDALVALLESLEDERAAALFSVVRRDGTLEVQNLTHHDLARPGDLAYPAEITILVGDVPLDGAERSAWIEMVAADLQTVGVDLMLPESELRAEAARAHTEERARTRNWGRRRGGTVAEVRPAGAPPRPITGRLPRTRRNDHGGIGF